MSRWIFAVTAGLVGGFVCANNATVRTAPANRPIVFFRPIVFQSLDVPQARKSADLNPLFPLCPGSAILDRAHPVRHPNPQFRGDAVSAKYIFVTGGVVSSLGKGLAAASIGCLLEARGLRINLMKFDPYLNVDPGTMSPFQHGEVFVTDDGAETDLDLGHYERFNPRQAHPRQQPDHRPHLRADHHQGAPRRLPRQDRPSHPPRHQ